MAGKLRAFNLNAALLINLSVAIHLKPFSFVEEVRTRKYSNLPEISVNSQKVHRMHCKKSRRKSHF